MEKTQQFRELADAAVWRAVPHLPTQLFKEHGPELMEKGAESPFLKELANLWQLRPAQPNDLISVNAAGPISSMLLGGLMGAGLGYGGGWLAERILPRRWQKGRLARTMAMAGGALGAAPGMIYGLGNVAAGNPFWKPTLEAGYEFPERPPVPQRPMRAPQSPSDAFGDKWAYASPEVKKACEKLAEGPGMGLTGIMGGPLVDVNEFNQVIWKDPRVARPLSPMQQAAATGLINSAANLPGKRNTGWVTPMDMGRLAAGMGSGYVSGALVGKGLGLLMGMPEEQQEKLKNTGMWAGIVANMVPIAFGG